MVTNAKRGQRCGYENRGKGEGKGLSNITQPEEEKTRGSHEQAVRAHARIGGQGEKGQRLKHSYRMEKSRKKKRLGVGDKGGTGSAGKMKLINKWSLTNHTKNNKKKVWHDNTGETTWCGT